VQNVDVCWSETWSERRWSETGGEPVPDGLILTQP
jgi:hypothetical protein